MSEDETTPPSKAELLQRSRREYELLEQALGGLSEAQISAAPDFADAAWQPLPLRVHWRWLPGRPRVAWVRFRDQAGALGSTVAVGPDSQRMWLPLAVH